MNIRRLAAALDPLNWLVWLGALDLHILLLWDRYQLRRLRRRHEAQEG